MRDLTTAENAELEQEAMSYLYEELPTGEMIQIPKDHIVEATKTYGLADYETYQIKYGETDGDEQILRVSKNNYKEALRHLKQENNGAFRIMLLFTLELGIMQGKTPLEMKYELVSKIKDPKERKRIEALYQETIELWEKAPIIRDEVTDMILQKN